MRGLRTGRPCQPVPSQPDLGHASGGKRQVGTMVLVRHHFGSGFSIGTPGSGSAGEYAAKEDASRACDRQEEENSTDSRQP